MRKLKLQVQMSVDGFVAGPNGEMDWMKWEWDDALKKFTEELTDSFDTILLGRNIAEEFVNAWIVEAGKPEADKSTHKINDTKKIVFSRTLQSCSLKNTELAKGELKEVVTALKNKPGKDLIVYGGAGLVASLIKEGLIDDFYIYINPAAIGSGLRIFDNITGYQKLKLIKAKGYDCGITVLHYINNNK